MAKLREMDKDFQELKGFIHLLEIGSLVNFAAAKKALGSLQKKYNRAGEE